MTSNICKHCTTTICSSSTTNGLHHEDFELLSKSASEQCIFCSRLQHDVETYIPQPESQKWPLYRWSLRRSATTRESKGMIALVFRPLAPSESVPNNDKDASPSGTEASDNVLLQPPRKKSKDLTKQKQRSSEVLKLPERTFHFYQERDLGEVPTATALGIRTDSADSWKRMAKWMADCSGPGHPRCRPRRIQRFVPTRLLNITEVKPWENVYGNIFVIETNSGDVNRNYATLSHAWGKNPTFITLTVKNRVKFMTEGIPWEALTKNFQEAIVVARQLRIEVIWIDSLCIVQGEGGDFMTEKDKMHQVYRQSVCNIAAADALDSTGGLFRPRQGGAEKRSSGIVPATLRLTAKNRTFGDEVWRVIPNDLWDSGLLQGSLYKRAWVFQERMLAPRILHFASNQVFWDCSTISACETLPGGLPRPLDTLAASDRHWRERLQDGLALKHRPLGGTADLSPEELWKTAVRNYTSCDLTNPGDKLSAIWGVAKLLRDALGERYGAGLWSEKLEEQLAWRVVDCQQGNGHPSVRPERPWVPSWSWASVDGIIEVQDRLTDRDFRVSNSLGGKIVFHTEQDESSKRSSRVQSPDQEFTLDEGLRLWTSRSPLSTPHLSRVNSGFSQDNENEQLSPQPYQYDFPRKQRNDDDHPKLRESGIEMKGCVREGHIRESDQAGKWTLDVRSDAGTTDSSVFETGNMEVFPDQRPHSPGRDCHLMVLTYTRNTRFVIRPGYDHEVPVLTYSGIGLVLKDEGDPNFSRIGSFRFHDFTEARASTITLVHGLDSGSRDGKIAKPEQVISLI